MSENVITPQELNVLIEQTYKVEKEFNDLKSSYSHLQDTVEKVIEFLPNAIWVVNSDNTIFLQNSRARELWDLLNLLEFKNEDYEVVHETRSYLIKNSSYQDKFMISAIDITEQKRKENLATMGQMAAHLSHEIRNPIGSIALLSSTLKKRVKFENVAIVQEIQNSIYKIERIIKATLMFSKGVQASKKEFNWMKLQNNLTLACGYYGYSKEISFKLLDENFTIEADFDLLEILFTNFLFNAIDAIELDDEDDGTVEIVYENDGEFHKFFITDSGVPIEDKNELFEAFKSTKVKGNGLGLVLSRQIAEAHGGYVKLMDGDKKVFEIGLKNFD